MTNATELYTFEAGPDSEPYQVCTSYTPEGVALALSALDMSREAVHGAILMLRSGLPGLLDSVILTTDGTGRTMTLRDIGEALESWTRFDQGETAWEERNCEPRSVDY